MMFMKYLNNLAIEDIMKKKDKIFLKDLLLELIIILKPKGMEENMEFIRKL